MSKIKCIIVDDEPPAVTLLTKYVDMIDSLILIGSFNSAIKAFETIKTEEIDLIFLDIRMPVLNGLDFLKSLKNPPAVVLTTAYREYALEGYDLDIIDYLLKPIPFDRFLKAVDRYIARKESTATIEVGDTREKEKFVYFNVNKTHHKVYFKDNLYLESLKDYVRVHMNESNLVVKGNLGTILKLLPSDQFIRTHRSFAVPFEQLTAYNQSHVHIGTIKIPIGVSYREEVSKKLQQ